jgi:hypothetical protein
VLALVGCANAGDNQHLGVIGWLIIKERVARETD